MARRVTAETLEEIRQRIDIADLIGSRITLKRSGSVFSLLPAGSRTRKLFCESSRTGRIFTPVVRTILEHRPASIIRFTASGKQEPRAKRGKQTRPPARKPAPKAPAGRQRNRR